MFVNGKFHLITKVKIVKKCIIIGLCIVNLYWLPPANEVWGKGICSQVSFLLSGEGSLHPRRGGLHPGGLHPGELGRPPPPRYKGYGQRVEIRILLECILVQNVYAL